MILQEVATTLPPPEEAVTCRVYLSLMQLDREDERPLEVMKS